MIAQNKDENVLTHPKTDAQGYERGTQRFNFEGLVDDSSYLIDRTAKEILAILEEDAQDAKEKEGGRSPTQEALSAAVAATIKKRYGTIATSDMPRTYKQIINAFYFVLERADLRQIVAQAHKKIEGEKTANEIVNAIAETITECMDSAHTNHEKDFQGYPFERTDSAHSPLIVTPELIEEFYKLTLEISSKDNETNLISSSIGQHLAGGKDGNIEGIELFRAIEKMYHEMRSPAFVGQLEAMKVKLYELIKQNVEFRNSAFNNGNFISFAATIAGIVLAMSNVDGMDKGLVIALSIAVFGLRMSKGANATQKVIDAYKAKIDIEFKQLLAVEKLLAILGGVITPMTSEELTYNVLQKEKGLSASAAQKINIRGQRLAGRAASLIGVVIAAVYTSKHIPLSESASLYEFIERILTGK